ncbi:hypothetical protein OG444_04150 [Streptomyces sp. NBC_01232]|uniref:hypothetical protein n=1 Tax=Streptomyces sp. NBC_01232 TaxID=2903786 RepID=UPI002E1619F8|nr:hypothetical protein OG444_04150 [Streptomyces sp. NBC_01232]
MSPQREIDEETAAGRLALFLVALTRGTSVRELADRFGRSSSSWGNYLNGSQLIPKTLVGKLVEAFTQQGVRRSTAFVRALELWNAADAERRASRLPGGGELVRQHQRRDDALQQVIKYQALAANAEKHLAELRPMLAYTQSRLENAELQLKLGGERERARVERRLGQAKERLSRVQVQQERARTRRMTAEEQQEFWMAEALVAQEEISRLEREAQDLVVVPPGSREPVRAETADAVDDSEFEARLEHITAEGLHDEALIEEDLQPNPADADPGPDPDEQLHALPVGPDPVQPVSRTVLDKPSTSSATDLRAATDSPAQAQAQAQALLARVPRSPVREEAVAPSRPVPKAPRPGFGSRAGIWLGLLDESGAKPGTTVGAVTRPAPGAGDTLLDGFVRTQLGILVAPVMLLFGITPAGHRAAPALLLKIYTGAVLLGFSVFMYLIGQDVAAKRADGASFADPVVGIPFCLAPLYGGLRLVRMPNTPAWILAAAIHLTWSVLLLFDLFPWTAPSFGTR